LQIPIAKKRMIKKLNQKFLLIKDNSKIRRLFVGFTIFAAVSVFAISDFLGPLEITLESDTVNGLKVLRTKGEELIVQDYDSEGNLWATQGMWVYRLKPGHNNFVRKYHIPTGFSIFWLRNFAIIRRLTNRPECVELLPMDNGNALVMSAGSVWYRAGKSQKFRKTLVLRHYGIGIGQGILNNGWDEIQDGIILFGEYFTNKKRSNIRLYRSDNYGKTWKIVHEFKPGQIRHVHSVQQDPYSSKAWILTGDLDHESMVAWTEDGGKTIKPIGQESQKWRVTQLVFTNEALFWGADTDNPEESGIYRWDRKMEKIEKLVAVSGEIYYATRLAEGTIVMSTVRTGARNEKDNNTRLWIIRKGKEITPIIFGTWDRDKRKAKLRFQRRQGNDRLAITVLNHQEYNDELFIISEETLDLAAKHMNK
jgi:hypothetical protein